MSWKMINMHAYCNLCLLRPCIGWDFLFDWIRHVFLVRFIVIEAYIQDSCSLLWCANIPHLCFVGFSNNHVCREN